MMHILHRLALLVLASTACIQSFQSRFCRSIHSCGNLKASTQSRDYAYEDMGEQDVEDFKSGFVSILGNPNVGKSTIMNALLNQSLSITSPKPQTTRHRILGVITEKDYQLVFSDTPGMIKPAYKLQEAMMDSVKGAASDADVILLVTDVYGEELHDEKIMKRLSETGQPVIVAINKMDLAPANNKKASTKKNLKSRLLKSKAPKNVPRPVVGPGEARSWSQMKAMSGSQPVSEVDEVGIPHPAVPSPVGEGGATARTDASYANEDPEIFDIFERIYSGDAEAMAEVEGQVEVNPIKGSSSDAANSNSGAFNEIFDGPQDKSTLEKVWKRRLPNAEIVGLSAANRKGLDELVTLLLTYMEPGPKYFPDEQVTNRDERFFASEIIRETLFFTLNEEIPYSCEVRIDSFKDRSPKLSAIEATIVVNRESQKSILIGKKGAKIKEIGSKAREKLEVFLDRKVFLQLFVKVDEDWRTKKDSLEKFGYIDSDFG